MLGFWFMELDGIRRKKTAPKGCCFLSLVRTERLELSHLSAPEPKSGASTNFATSAKQTYYTQKQHPSLE